MKKLDVPYFRQQQDTDCLTACAKMVMDYHCIDIDYDDMIKSLDFYEVGLCNPQIGTYLLNKGLKVELDMMNPFVLTVKDIGKTQAEIHDKFKQMPIKNPQFDMIRNHFVTFMDKGGKVNPAILTKQIIIDELDAGRPVIVPFASTMVYGYKDGYNFHSNVITGYEGNYFFTHDPADPAQGGGSHKADQDLVMNAIHIIGHADFDNASIVKISL